MIDEKKLIEEIKSLQVKVNGLIPGRVLREYEKQYKESILRIIEEQPKEDVPFAYVNKWIPVDEQLPENDKFVLVNWTKYYSNENYISILALNPFGEWYGELGIPNGKVISWMPLPEPFIPYIPKK